MSHPRTPRRFASACLRLEDRTLPSLVAAYSFDEGTGNVLHDVSGNGNDGTVASATWSSGKYGGALTFTGASGSSVTVNDSASLDLTTGMTVEAWVSPTKLTSPDANWCAAVAKDRRNSSNDISYA